MVVGSGTPGESLKPGGVAEGHAHAVKATPHDGPQDLRSDCATLPLGSRLNEKHQVELGKQKQTIGSQKQEACSNLGIRGVGPFATKTPPLASQKLSQIGAY
jgi:hypothetical protein